jgi:hypothetical protein
MSVAVGLELLAGVVGVLLVLVARELLRLRDRVTRLESRLNGR